MCLLFNCFELVFNWVVVFSRSSRVVSASFLINWLGCLVFVSCVSIEVKNEDESNWFLMIVIVEFKFMMLILFMSNCSGLVRRSSITRLKFISVDCNVLLFLIILLILILIVSVWLSILNDYVKCIVWYGVYVANVEYIIVSCVNKLYMIVLIWFMNNSVFWSGFNFLMNVFCNFVLDIMFVLFVFLLKVVSIG